jgi:CRISPR-associated protein Csx10
MTAPHTPESSRAGLEGLALHIDLLDDLVFSSRSATSGAHSSLDRIPGGALWGLVASALYGQLSPQDAWLLFHSGQLRFLDGLPQSPSGERSLPVPLSWHADKANANAPAHSGGHWQAQAIYNLAFEQTLHAEVQPRSLRQGYTSLAGERLQPEKQFRMMTAIGTDGRAAEAQLFGYESLRSGQRFEARVVFGPDLPAPWREKLVTLLEGQHRLGRSKSTQYGRVQLRAVPWQAPPPHVEGDTLRLLLVSDACLQDLSGLPTLEAQPAHLGLSEAGLSFIPELSFVRARRYSPWNAHRGSYQSERQLLVAGSVITLKSERGWPLPWLQGLQAGIGIHRASGLGEVCIHSPLLQGAQPVFAPKAPVAAPERSPAALAAPTDATAQRLLQLLERRAGIRSGQSQAEQWVQSQLKALLNTWQTLRSYLALDDKAAYGPGNTQWGMVADEARRARTVAELRATLLGSESQAGKVPPQDKAWVGERALPESVPSLRDWLAKALDDLAAQSALGPEPAKLEAWQRLCAHARKGQGAKGQAELKRWKKEIDEAHRAPAPNQQEAA